jgi:GNAT superfamily N-acetyltransferase
MASKLQDIEVLCDCGNKRIIKRIPSRDYTNWKCSSCAIKNKWADEQYRKNRNQIKRKPSKLIGRKLTTNHKNAISNSMKNRWTDIEYYNKMINIFNSPNNIKLLSKLSKDKWQNAEFRNKMIDIIHLSNGSRSEKCKKLWLNEEFRQKVITKLNSDECKRIRSINAKNMWTDELRKIYKTDEFRNKISKLSKELWQNEEYRNKVLNAKNTTEHKELMRKIQKSPDYISKLSIAYSKLPRVSNLQRILYQILDDLNIEYYGEINDSDKCIVGPWTFDCVIKGAKNILIECQGEWIHSLPHKIVADNAKAEYINTYMSDTYEIKYLWEHQFASYNCISDLIKLWTGNKYDQVDFEFNDIIVKKCPASEYKYFLQAYHYLMNAGRGGQAYGAYLDNKLIAVCIFSPLPRQNITIKTYHDFTYSNSVDLSRLCIHPKYQKKNFGSRFISKCIKMLSNNVKYIISYADQTFNHNGGVYKASNFVFDGYSKPSYWYISENGWVMHKKTLYNKAINLNMREYEYAEKHMMRKVHGGKKLKFVFKR